MKDETAVFIDGPVVKVGPAKASGTGWVTSGTVSYPIRVGRNQVGSIDFPYEGAPSEREAIRQSSHQLSELARLLGQLAQRIANQ